MIVGVDMRVIRAITIKRLQDLGQQAEVLCDLCTIILDDYSRLHAGGRTCDAMQCYGRTSAKTLRRCAVNQD